MALRLLNGDAATSRMVEAFDTIGDYSLVEFIGRGGMGEVWLGFKLGTTRPRAIKILLPELSKKIASVESFRREAEIGMQLARHDSIVGVDSIHEAFIGDPECPERVLYLVLDFVDGINLRRLSDRYYRAKRQRLPIPLVVHIVRAMLRALQKAHTHAIDQDALPVVHGDINPGNVLISSHGEVRITDFGISRFVPEPTFISRPVGTLPYMAPEQYSGRICPQNDLYSVGAVLHELLTGEPPLPDKGSPRTMERKLLKDPIPPLGRDDVPPALDRLRRGLLEKNWELRIQTALVALEILATVDRTDCQDELKGIYTRLFGPPRSRLTRFLQAHGDSSGSFVVGLLRHRRRPITAEDVADNGPGDPPEPDHDEAMPWLVEEDDALTTEVHQRPATRLSPTLRLDVPVGTVPPVGAPSTPTVPESSPAANESPAEVPDAAPQRDAESDDAHVAGRLLEPGDDEDDLDLMTTAPRNAAGRSAPPAQGSQGDAVRYPPRPDHLDDGVPFQLHRPHRGAKKLHVPADASESDSTSTSEDTTARGQTGPQNTRTPSTGRPPSSQSHSDALIEDPATKNPPQSTAPARRLGAVCLTAAALLAAVFGFGWIASSFADPGPTAPTSKAPHHARVATTGE